MFTIWTKHLKDQEDKVRFERSVRDSKWILDHLMTIIDEKNRSLSAAEIYTTVYDNPNWQFKQADCNGYKRCLRDMKSLINLDHKETDDRQPTGRPNAN